MLADRVFPGNGLRSGLAALLILVAVTGRVGAQAPQSAATLPAIEYGYPDQSIFIATQNAQGQVDSPMIRLAAALFDRAGIPWHATSYPAPRLYKNLKDGTTDFSILVRATALDSCCLFSKAPVYGTELNVYRRGDAPAIRHRDDLIGKNVITISGYSYAGLLVFINDPAHRIRNEVAATHAAAFDMLLARRADYVLDYASAAADILAPRSIAGLEFDTIDRLDIHLVLSKKYPDAARVMVRLEAVAKTLDKQVVLKGRDR